jgi:hypothetical protein
VGRRSRVKNPEPNPGRKASNQFAQGSTLGVAKGEEAMRDSTSTIRNSHIRIPSMRDAKSWTEKVFNNEKTGDAALFVMAVMLCGWLVYCLDNAFQKTTYLM